MKRLELTGQKFNRLTVKRFHSSNKHNKACWLCICDCGNELIVSTGDLKRGHTKSCGCLNKECPIKFVDMKGQTFERLTAIKFDRLENGHTYWLCRCICGNEISTSNFLLLRGHTRSCGCLQIERTVKASTTHGMTHTKFHLTWKSMRARCLRKTDTGYPNYGGRGIKVCDRWLESFENFRDDMYPSYLEHAKIHGEKNTTLDRIEVMGNYEPSNCRWSTPKEQNRNTRATAITENYDEHKNWKLKLISRLNAVIRLNVQTSPLLESYLGCSIYEFKKYIESQFTNDMTWSNHGSGVNKWQFDHIVGCNNFDLSKEEDRKTCFNFKNLRPMWGKDHQNKSTRRLTLV